MKKSTALKYAELAVLTNEIFEEEDKLEILKVLIDEENIARICEGSDKEEEEENG